MTKLQIEKMYYSISLCFNPIIYVKNQWKWWHKIICSWHGKQLLYFKVPPTSSLDYLPLCIFIKPQIATVGSVLCLFQFLFYESLKEGGRGGGGLWGYDDDSICYDYLYFSSSDDLYYICIFLYTNFSIFIYFIGIVFPNYDKFYKIVHFSIFP